MEYFVPLPNTSPVFTASALLLPQPSLASLPQLATDLLVHTLHLQLIGHLGLRDYIPAVGGLDFVEGEAVREGICLGVEVYQNENRTLTVVLSRSPVIRARKPHHLVALKAFVEAAGFSEVLLVAAVDAGARGDVGLREATPLRHFTLGSPSNPIARKLAKFTPPYTNAPGVPLFPQGGLTRKILESFYPAAPSAPTVSALLIYAAEGDNADLAVFLADVLAEVLEVEVDKDGEGRRRWKQPKSWETGLLGAELGRERVGEMYG